MSRMDGIHVEQEQDREREAQAYFDSLRRLEAARWMDEPVTPIGIRYLCWQCGGTERLADDLPCPECERVAAEQWRDHLDTRRGPV